MHIKTLIPLLGLWLISAGCRTHNASQSAAQNATENGLTNEIAGPLAISPAPARVLQIEAAPAITPPPANVPVPGTIAPRTGDEIVVAGEFVHTGSPVVLWLDPGGYDAYRVERRFSPPDEASWQATQEAGAGFDSPNRYDQRGGPLTPEERERVRGGGWDLPTLQRCIDQIVMHYDVAGTSRQCFKVLHDVRDLSVHFMVDLDGTIYQTLDVKERARHAGGANDRSIGIEIANIGAYPPDASGPLDQWYARDPDGQVRVTLPARFGDGGLRTANFTPRPARADAVTNEVQGRLLMQYDFTPEQYQALSHLVATLCRVLPQIQCDCPRDEHGQVPLQKLPDDALANFHGVLGHYHLTTNKIDPGPAFQWDTVIGEARRLLAETNTVPPRP
ncbi:MAG TPA: peptidoglycan recognition family protein [Verrucomicrobiae bacterium]|nr:peptidoglycan recognition family protein [Verrucomicrobiae bacterium]